MSQEHSTKYTVASPEEELPCINLRTAFKLPQHPNEQLTDEQIGHTVCQNYTIVPNSFAKSFIAYQDQHAMGQLRDKLKSGMDKISCDYVDQHERVMDLARHQLQCLILKQSLWTDYDRKLFAHNRQMVLNPPMEWLAVSNLEGNSIVTNCYGLVDFPKEVLEKVNGKAIIDGGAFIGDTLPVFLNLFPESVTYCFEPCTPNYAKLQSFAGEFIANKKVIPVKCGLGNNKCTMQLNQSQENSDSRASVKINYQDQSSEHNLPTEQIEITTVDDFVSQNHIQVGLIKMDIEGFEPEAIQGAINTIKEQKPMLLIAIYHTPEEFYELKGYLEELNLGYKFAIRRSAFTNSLTELVLVAYQE